MTPYRWGKYRRRFFLPTTRIYPNTHLQIGTSDRLGQVTGECPDFGRWIQTPCFSSTNQSSTVTCPCTTKSINFLYVFTDTFEVLFELSGFTYFLHHLIDAIKPSTLSILTMPASSPLSASFIAESVVSFGISASKLSVIPTIVTPFINPKTLLRCSKMEGLSICKVIVVIIPISYFTLQR